LKLVSLLYVSRSALLPEAAPEAVKAIVATSRGRNPDACLTGALLFTGEHFAQVLEGSPAAVDDLMARVAKDPRHTEIIIIARKWITVRRFGDWSMAYSGPSQFVSRHVTRLLEDPRSPGQGRSAKWLKDLLWEFAEGPGAT